MSGREWQFGDCPELNLSNYDELDVQRLNDWAIEANGELERLRKVISETRDRLATIVCTDGDDKGVVMLSNDSPTDYVSELRANVYRHEYFSPLGDALIEAWEKLEADPPNEPEISDAAIDPGEGWRLLDRKELTIEGDELQLNDGSWVVAGNWRSYGGKQSPHCPYRRRITPPLQLREGAWYERRDGQVVGPCNTHHGDTCSWDLGGYYYLDNGVAPWAGDGRNIIREVPAPAVWRPATIDDLKRAPIEARFRDNGNVVWSKPLTLVGYRVVNKSIGVWICECSLNEWDECEVLEQGPAV